VNACLHIFPAKEKSYLLYSPFARDVLRKNGEGERGVAVEKREGNGKGGFCLYFSGDLSLLPQPQWRPALWRGDFLKLLSSKSGERVFPLLLSSASARSTPL